MKSTTLGRVNRIVESLLEYLPFNLAYFDYRNSNSRANRICGYCLALIFSFLAGMSSAEPNSDPGTSGSRASGAQSTSYTQPTASETRKNTGSNEETNSLIEEITVIGYRVGKPLTTSLDAHDVARIAGTQDDPIAALAALPGIAVNNDFEGGFAVLGSRPIDNRYFLDFLPVGYLFHLTGLSIVDGDVTDEISLYPAGYGAMYQGVIGGVIDINTRNPTPEKGFHGLIDANFLHAGVLMEGSVSDQHHILLSTRASYYDVVVGSIIEELQEREQTGTDIIQLPRYRDYTGRYQIDLDRGATLKFLLDGSSDQVEFLFEETAASVILDPIVAGNHRFRVAFNRQGIVYDNANSRTGQFTAGVGRIETVIGSRSGGIGIIESRSTETVVRFIKNVESSGAWHWVLGSTVSDVQLDYNLVVRDNGCTQFDSDCRFSDHDLSTALAKRRLTRGNTFVENIIDIKETVSFAIGIGYAFDNYLDEYAVEPRVRLNVDFSPKLSAAVRAGRYSQMPSFEYIESELGNPELGYLGAEHYAFGINYRSRGWLLSIDAYYKSFDHLITSDPRLKYDDHGDGEARGVGLMLRAAPDPWSLWFSLTYSHSTRFDSDTGQQFDFKYDQPFISALLVRYDLSDQISLSGRAAFHTGPPYTPIVDAVEDPTGNADYLPIYGEINGSRLPPYFRLDLRLDWQLQRRAQMRVYFEAINVTNRNNVFDYEYNRDYTDRKDVEQLPFFVSVGISKKW